ncbi:hypothetical protein LTR28_001698, partial [Elasticomyces elasticus]
MRAHLPISLNKSSASIPPSVSLPPPRLSTPGNVYDSSDEDIGDGGGESSSGTCITTTGAETCTRVTDGGICCSSIINGAEIGLSSRMGAEICLFS